MPFFVSSLPPPGGGYRERRARAAPTNTPETPTSTLPAYTTSINNLEIDSRP